MSGACGSVQAAGALGQHPPGSLVTTNIFFCRTHFIITMEARGLPLTSPASVVVVTGPAASNPQGVRHRRLQHRWWPLPDLPSAPPMGPAINVFNIAGGRCQKSR
jgi:hypothetical protein